MGCVAWLWSLVFGVWVVATNCGDCVYYPTRGVTGTGGGDANGRCPDRWDGERDVTDPLDRDAAIYHAIYTAP